jgi:hypothetical protein
MEATGTIPLAQVLKHVDSGLPFDMLAISADRRRGIAGKKIELRKWTKNHQPQNSTQPKGRVHQAIRRDPNVFDNKTRILFNPKNGSKKTVHIKLIKIFNGKEVTL